MKKILCFGDSNTYGYVPGSGERYNSDTRWTGVLQNLLGKDFQVIEAGCNNRTCFVDNPDGKMFTGYKILPEFLADDLNYVILAIGVNDLQLFFNATYDDIKNGIINLVNITRERVKNANILIVAPPKISKDVLYGNFSFQFNEKSIEKSHKIGEIYRTVTEEYNCLFLDLDKIIKVSTKDGLHYEPEAHKKIAQEIYKIIKEKDIL